VLYTLPYHENNNINPEEYLSAGIYTLSINSIPKYQLHLPKYSSIIK